VSSAAPARPDGGQRGADGELLAPGDDGSATDAGESNGAGSRSPGSPAARDVAAIFDEIAPVYDRLESILSLGLDGRWRAAVVASSGVRPGDSAIDVGAGTGKLAAVLADRVGPFGRVVAVDLSPAMIARGTTQTRDLVQLEFVLADACALPYDDGEFGAATITFGLGTLPDLTAGLTELRRVVRPGGRVVCLEPTMARPRWWGRIYHRTARRLAPLAMSVGGRREAYRRLATLVRNVPDADVLADLMRSVGLVDVSYRRLGLGAVALHSGTAPEG
jgi:demethylmenaquinone methyltransferase / 2-methoxy-6-polyprenyl-1,4-benzoquinol methylase